MFESLEPAEREQAAALLTRLSQVHGGADAMRADGYLLPRRATLLAMSGVLLGMLLAALNQTIVATALPRIVGDLGGMEHYSWVFTAYMLAATVTTPIYGRLSDVYGRRRFFVAGIVIFMAGAVISGFAGSMTQLVAGRAVQGLGAGALIPLAVATIGDLIPPSERGRWQGLTGAVFGFASVIGPTTGGWISDHADWRWVFFVSLPVGVIALAVVAATLKIPPHPERGTKVDYAGAGLLAFGLSAGLLAIVQGGPPELYAISRRSCSPSSSGGSGASSSRSCRSSCSANASSPRRTWPASRSASGCSAPSCSCRSTCRA